MGQFVPSHGQDGVNGRRQKSTVVAGNEPDILVLLDQGLRLLHHRRFFKRHELITLLFIYTIHLTINFYGFTINIIGSKFNVYTDLSSESPIVPIIKPLGRRKNFLSNLTALDCHWLAACSIGVEAVLLLSPGIKRSQGIRRL